MKTEPTTMPLRHRLNKRYYVDHVKDRILLLEKIPQIAMKNAEIAKKCAHHIKKH